MELFDRIQHPDSLINRIQDKILKVVNAIARKEILDGHVITADVGNTETAVEHGLGRVPQGWILLNGPAGTLDACIEMSPPDDKFLYLAFNGAQVDRKFWVF